MGYTFFHLVGHSDSIENIKAVLAWVNKEELYSHRLELLKAPITGNDEAFNGSTFFHLVNNHSELLLEFIQTLANEGRNLEFMLHPNKRYQFPIFLLMGVQISGRT